jgi:hypothetical protein
VRTALVAAAATLVAAAAGWLLRDRTAEEPVVRTAAFELVPFEPGGPVGVAYAEQEGSRVRGWASVWGLRPGTGHALHLGPTGPNCAAERPRPVLRLRPMRADENGVAFARFATEAEPGQDVIAPAWALTVHTAEGVNSARAACGAAAPGERLTDAALTGAGPASAARADVAGLVQLRGGRPTGGVRTLRARVGERVALAVRSDRPDELTLRGAGLTLQVGPGTVARFSVRPRRPGRLTLMGPSTGRRPVLIVDVRR